MKLVMIGHGMVGHKFIESVLEHAGDEVGNHHFGGRTSFSV